MALNSRMQRERKTVQVMIRMYCKAHHHPATAKGLCPECEKLALYADKRLDSCPFENGKTTCSRCPVHCYKTDMREKIRSVMRYAGPRMIWHHPVLALMHLIDGQRKRPKAKKSNTA